MAWGDVLYRGTALWRRLPAGTSGKFLRTNGAGADPSWETPSGAGNVTTSATLTSGKTIIGNGTVDVTVSSLTATVANSSSGTLGTATAGTDYTNLAFKTIAVSGQSDVVADTAADTLTLIEGSGMTITTSAAGDSITFASTGSGSGVVVQVVNTQTGSSSTGTTILPVDDTIPQKTEGDEYMTLAVTPTDAANQLKIDVVINISNSGANNWSTAALFQDAANDALAVGVNFNTAATANVTISFSHYMTAGTTSATTFKVRAGGNVASTTTFNGGAGSRRFGGVLISGITIWEIVP